MKTGSPLAIADEDPLVPGMRVIAADEGMRKAIQSMNKSIPHEYPANFEYPVIMIIGSYPMMVKEH
jgi:hypothetical protein